MCCDSWVFYFNQGASVKAKVVQISYMLKMVIFLQTWYWLFEIINVWLVENMFCTNLSSKKVERESLLETA